ncbi:MAG: zinc-ribbon domain-containing protein [Anaerolineae bacterium]
MKPSHLFTRIKRRVRLRVGVASLITIGLLMALLAPQMSVKATDQAQEGTTELCGGECLHKTITFETGEDVSADRVDVVFLMDASGSMGDELSNVQGQSIEIMNDLRDLVADSAFGAASFVDYNNFADSQYGELYGSGDDYAYRLDQDITTDANAVRDALNSILLENGEDWPESYSRALWEMQFLNWRENSKRIVILFGDALPHDRTFFGVDYGTDPGRDEIENTADDLVFEQVVQELVEAQIAVIGVNSNYDLEEETSFFKYVSEQTGGQYFPLSDASEIPEAVVQLVGEEISTISRLTVRATDGYQDWIASTPESYSDVGPETFVSFDVDICPPADTLDGLHEFDLIVDGDGIALETIPISIEYSSRCGGPDVFMADHPDDDGNVCSNPNNEPFWMSEDIVVRHRDDGVYLHQNPIRGQTNYIYTRVRNIGDEDANGARVTTYWANAAIGLNWPGDWHQVGSTTVDVPVGESVQTEALAWEPPGASGEDHFCLLARVELDADPIRREGDVPCDNNIVQRNLHVLDLDPDETVSSDEVEFIIIAPADGMGQVDVVVIIPEAPPGTKVSIIMPPDLFERWQDAGGELEGGSTEGDQVVADPDARETVIQDVPLEPGEETEFAMRIEASVNDETAPFSITVVERVDGQDVGGNTYYYVPPEQPGSLLDLVKENLIVVGGASLCCGGFLIVAIVVGAVLILRRRSQSRISPPPPPPPAPPATPLGLTCPQCGASLRDGATFCPQCGSPVPKAAPPASAADRFCPNCGASIRERARFCAQCGTRF